MHLAACFLLSMAMGTPVTLLFHYICQHIGAVLTCLFSKVYVGLQSGCKCVCDFCGAHLLAASCFACRQSASACVQSKKSAEQVEKAGRQLVEQANRKAMDAEAAAERYVKTTGILI